MHFKGHNGQIETDATGLTIRRRGFLGTMTHAFKGEKRIPFASISAVQFRPSGMFTTGYIQFSILGGVESRGALWDATTDENSVVFKPGKQEEDFKRLRRIVEEAIEELRAPPRESSPRQAPIETRSIADELMKLAELRDRGVITDQELEEQKRMLLGR